MSRAWRSDGSTLSRSAGFEHGRCGSRAAAPKHGATLSTATRPATTPPSGSRSSHARAQLRSSVQALVANHAWRPTGSPAAIGRNVASNTLSFGRRTAAARWRARDVFAPSASSGVYSAPASRRGA